MFRETCWFSQKNYFCEQIRHHIHVQALQHVAFCKRKWIYDIYTYICVCYFFGDTALFECVPVLDLSNFRAPLIPLIVINHIFIVFDNIRTLFSISKICVMVWPTWHDKIKEGGRGWQHRTIGLGSRPKMINPKLNMMILGNRVYRICFGWMICHSAPKKIHIKLSVWYFLMKWNGKFINLCNLVVYNIDMSNVSMITWIKKTADWQLKSNASAVILHLQL